MFIARWKDKLVIGEENGYYDFEVSFDNFNWNIAKGKKFIERANFISEINQYPVYDKAKIICVGKNYMEHAKEMGSDVPSEPLLFWKPRTSLLSPKGKIVLPKMSKDVQHETELVVIIGKKGKNIPTAEAMDYVLGYTIGLDITARDLQRSDKTWFRGKGFDTFAPVGPVIVPKDKINLENCPIKLLINGKERQNGNTKDFIFKLPTIINYTSQIVTLEPGDLIYTGTPEGVSTIFSGDQLKAEIPNIGILEVSVA